MRARCSVGLAKDSPSRPLTCCSRKTDVPNWVRSGLQRFATVDAE